MALLDRIANAREEARQFPIDLWLTDYLIPSLSQFSFNGHTYPVGLQQTLTGERVQRVANTLPGYSMALRMCPPAFAAQMVRALVLSQARFTFRNLPSSSSPRRTFGNRDLAVLERPWPNGTTGDLLSLMEWHAGLAGNAYVVRQQNRLRVLRPDWVGILYGSDREPEDPALAFDSELLGYLYWNGGMGGRHDPVPLTVADVAHWTPIPDPEGSGYGMSWITPAILDIQGDRAAALHKLKFFENGATPNMVVKGIPAATKKQFDEAVDTIESRHTGIRNAYRTLYLTAGADATVVGSDLRQLDFTATQGKGETRIALLSRVPATILQISEGLQGSSLNAGNFAMARRMLADGWVFPTLQGLCAALAPLVRVPLDSELWSDTSDMPLLREDARDAAEIEQVKEAIIVAYVNGGFTPESAVAAVRAQDVSLLKHTGLVSVQLQPPGTAFRQGGPATPNGNGAPPPGTRGEGELGDIKARHLIRWYNEGADGQIPWGSPGDFNACVAVAGRHVRDPKGFCAERHHDVLGIWPATHAKELKGGK